MTAVTINDPTFLLLMFLCVIVNGSSLFVLRNGIFLNPLACFIGVFTLQIIGTYPLLDPRLEADQMHGFLLFVVCTVVFFVSILTNKNLSRVQKYWVWRQTPMQLSSLKERWVIMLLLVISFAASLLYYRIVGYNLFQLALSGGVDDFTTMRLQSYAGERYTGAGVFNQFKNTILPISFLAALMLALQRRKLFSFGFLVFVCGPLFLYCILGTGQRAFLFYSLVIFLIYTVNQRSKNVLLVILIATGFIFLFNMYSVLLGRGSEDGGNVFSQLHYRLFSAQQWGAVNGFRYVYTLDTVWGSEWAKSFTGLIPGVKGSTLSNEIHGYMYVSTRGTVPVSLWGSSFHNFGAYGVVLAAAVWSLLLAKLNVLILSFRKTPLFLMTSAALVLYSGLSVIAGPAQVFNFGLFGIIFILLVGRVFVGPILINQLALYSRNYNPQYNPQYNRYGNVSSEFFPNSFKSSPETSFLPASKSSVKPSSKPSVQLSSKLSAESSRKASAMYDEKPTSRSSLQPSLNSPYSFLIPEEGTHGPSSKN